MTVKVDVTTGTIEHKFGTRVHSMHVPADKGLQILGYLARARQTRRTAEEILQAVWPPNTVIDPHVIDVHLTTLRAKLRMKGRFGAALAARIKSRNGRKFLDLSPGNNQV